ncbi:hypothetical protein R5R35_009525 [Gryllus longicercus]|uniref:Dehydrogenase/reductase SDR family member 11 n=1 Tax=Gryllus longicercus TaxID=2509291 RepID=A0AAN9VKG2_9ORTH
MERWQGRVALVTGASAGIGAAIAYQLQDAGLTVIGVARRAEKISAAVEAARQEAAKRGRVSLGRASQPGELHCVKCDVSNEQDVIDAFRWAKRNVGGVDILVNNAAVLGEHKLADAPTAEWKKILDINVLGLSICTREAVQQMRSRGIGDGHIIHIGGISSHSSPGAYACSMYFASKHAVRVLTEGLRKELVAAKSRIRITEICPGNVKTDIWSGLTSMTSDQVYKEFPYLEAEDVADTVLYVISAPAHVQIHDIIVRPVGEVW